MLKYKVLTMIALSLLCVPGMAYAADSAEAQNADQFLKDNVAEAPASDKKDEAVAEKKEDKPQESPDMIAKKIALATEMHKIRPTNVQIDSAIERSAQGLPEAERGPFVAAMKSALNYNAVEKISIDAMVDTFTLSELEAMVAYHSKPEAQNIAKKMPEWAKKVQPEIIRMLDAAMMRVRTGTPSAGPAPSKP